MTAEGKLACATCAAAMTSQLAEQVEEICWKSDETDLLSLLGRVRDELKLQNCGLAYHAVVPAAIMVVYRNCGGDITREALSSAIGRGLRVQEGWCGLAGACGAGLGVGLAFSVIRDVNPIAGQGRLNMMAVTTEVLRTLCAGPDSRCCFREAWLSLQKAAELSEQYLPIALSAEGKIVCSGHINGSECQRIDCPLSKETA